MGSIQERVNELCAQYGELADVLKVDLKEVGDPRYARTFHHFKNGPNALQFANA